jgi:hypothetical protein
LLDGKGRRHGQHNTRFDTKAKKKRRRAVTISYGNMQKCNNIATKEDWKNDINGRVAYQLMMMVEIKF